MRDNTKYIDMDRKRSKNEREKEREVIIDNLERERECFFMDWRIMGSLMQSDNCVRNLTLPFFFRKKDVMRIVERSGRLIDSIALFSC